MRDVCAKKVQMVTVDKRWDQLFAREEYLKLWKHQEVNKNLKRQTNCRQKLNLILMLSGEVAQLQALL